jgi:drug/metabolite transporter (DMT)-like permease
MIYGLIAAFGWGFADYGGAVAGRRIGSVTTVVVAQGLSAVVMTIFFVVSGHHMSELSPIVWWLVLGGSASAVAYIAHYRALQLGPLVVVSPVTAAYAVVGVGLSMVVLHERPGLVALLGALVTIVGVMLASTDLKKLRAGTHGFPAGLRWALLAALMFGIGGFVLGWGSKQIGWVPSLWASRSIQMVWIALLAVARPRDLKRVGSDIGTWMAVAAGVTDLIGVGMFSIGARAGFLSVVLVASAIFPLIAVGLSVAFLHERPVKNQLIGAVVVVAGLVLLGLG